MPSARRDPRWPRDFHHRRTAGLLNPLQVLELARSMPGAEGRDGARVPVVDARPLPPVGPGEIAVTWLGHSSALLRVVPLYVAFAARAVGVGLVAGRVVRLDVAGRRAVVFATVTRNSLVVLPLALALPPSLALAPLAVVTQTLVELVVMVLLVRVVPRVVPGAERARPSARGPAAG